MNYLLIKKKHYYSFIYAMKKIKIHNIKNNLKSIVIFSIFLSLVMLFFALSSIKKNKVILYLLNFRTVMELNMERI